MLRLGVLPFRLSLQLLRAAGGRAFSSRKAVIEASDEEVQAARSWLQRLDAETIPRTICEVSFSRSSGPGGQNVNKVNSKATLKVGLDALLKHVPRALHSEIRASRFVTERSNSVVIQADGSRKQNDNISNCFKKLHQMIVEAGNHALPGETSAEQAQRVKDLQKFEDERRLRSKKLQSSKKSSRKSRGDD